jgi:hypothetical protein
MLADGKSTEITHSLGRRPKKDMGPRAPRFQKAATDHQEGSFRPFYIDGIFGTRSWLYSMAYSFRMSPGRCLPKTLKARGETRSMNEITKKVAAMGRLKKINGLPPEMIRD